MKNVISSEVTGLEVYKQPWWCLLATTGNMAVFPGNNRECKPHPSNLIG